MEARYFSPAQVFVATLFGTPIAGAIAIFFNFRKTRKAKYGLVVLIAAIVYVILAALFPVFFGFTIQSLSFVIGISIGFYQITSKYLIALNSEWEIQVPTRSWWWAIVITVGGLAVIFALNVIIQLVMGGVSTHPQY